MSDYLLKFGSYTFKPTFAPTHREQQNVVPVAKLPSYYGARSIQGSQDITRCVIRGGLVTGPISTPGVTDIEAERDSMLYNLLTIGSPSDLYFGRNDRYFHNAQLDRWSDDYDPNGWRRVVTMELSFVCPDPHQHSITQKTDTWSPSASGQTHIITVAGTARAEPKLSITVPGSGSKTIAYAITNNSNVTGFTLAGDVNGGDVIEVDAYEKTVVIGSDDRIDLFDGRFITALVGANSIAETYGAVGIDRIDFSWRDRYI